MKFFLKNGLKLLFILLLVSMFVYCTQADSTNSGGSSGSSDKDDDNDPSDGTITVNLINGAASNGITFVIGIFNDGADPTVDSSVNGGSDLITPAGTATFTSISFSGGSNYDIWVFTDEDGSGTSQPNSGDLCNDAAIDASIDGNQTVTVDYNTLELVP